jgi:hypothetical protein
MPDPAYRVAREAALRLASQLRLTPPFDVERVASRYALVLDEEIPTRADVIVLHAERAGERPRIVVDTGLESLPRRRRFAIAHGLGHVLLGWHPLGAPCDVGTRPFEWPVTVHDLVEGEASAFARELLMPAAWIRGFDALDRPALLARHVAERAGQPLMPAARSVAQLLDAGSVWCVSDQWDRVVDAGRSPGTRVCAPRAGDELDIATYSRHATLRHREAVEGLVLTWWWFDAAGSDAMPHDRTARGIARDIALELGLGEDGAKELASRMDGVAGWANEQLGTASLDGMRRVIDERAHAMPELARIAAHEQFPALVDAKATELVANRLAR